MTIATCRSNGLFSRAKSSSEAGDRVRCFLYEEYHPYGTTAFRSSSGATGFAPKRYRYTGKERDEETGLYYYGARYYPPWLARWTAVDQEFSTNVYDYCSCNPVTMTDPDGRAPVETSATVVKGKSADPYSKGGAVLTFKHDGKTVEVKLKLRPVVEPKSGPGESDTVRDPTTGEVKSVILSTGSKVHKGTDDTSAWKIGAELTYDPAAGKDPLGADSGKWEFGVIQNAEDLDYKFTYGGAEVFGGAVKQPSLDIAPGQKSGAPFLGPDAKTTVGFGTQGITAADAPHIEVPAEAKVHAKLSDKLNPFDVRVKAELQQAVVKGKFTTWYVLRHKDTGETIYLYRTTYTLSRSFEGRGTVMTGVAGTATKDEGVGKGTTSPVLTGPTTAELLRKEFRMPKP